MPQGNLKSLLKTAVREERKQKIRNENWQGKLLRARRDDQVLNLEGCFAWLERCADSQHYRNDGTNTNYIYCTQHAKLVQLKVTSHAGYVIRHRRALHLCYVAVLRLRKKDTFKAQCCLQILLFEKLSVLGLVDSVPPWYSRVEPKPLYKSSEGKAQWDVPVFTEHEYLLQNRVDARSIDDKEKTVIAVEMSCS